jgi:hypothetical protein
VSTEASDFRFEIIQAPPRTFAVSGGPTPIDLTLPLPGRVSLDGFGQINRAIDRNLLTFKTGDVTLQLINRDGYFDDLFAFLGPTDRWTLRIFRRDLLQFTGTIMGLGSIRYDRDTKTVELTAYGASRALADASGARVARGPIGILPNGAPIDGSGTETLMVDSIGGFVVGDILDAFDGTTEFQTNLMRITSPNLLGVQPGSLSILSPGAQVYRITRPMTITSTSGTTLTLNTTQGLLPGDVFHLTDQVNSEDVTVKQVTSATVITTTATIAHSYAAGSAATLSTPFYRYKAIDPLARELFNAAGISVAEVKLQNSQFSNLGPSPVNPTGLPTFSGLNPAYTCPAQRNGREYLTLLVDGTHYQASPDVAWVKEDATIRAWVDWSPYFVQASAGPAIVPRTPSAAEANNTTDADPHICGWDLRGATMLMYRMQGAGAGHLRYTGSTDGTTWATPADSDVALNPAIPGLNARTNNDDWGVEFDPVRNQVLAWNTNGSPDTLQLYDVATGVWTNLLLADDTGYVHGGFRYCADLDLFIGLRSTAAKGPAFQVIAYRGAARQWVRAFPTCLIQTGPGVLNYPTHSLRYVNGSLYCVLIADGNAQLLRTSDQFRSFVIRPIMSPSTNARTFGGRVNGAYQIAAYTAAPNWAPHIAAPFYAGVIPYADFTGLSVSQALQNLAVLTNAVAWVDDDMQGHFVARDLLPVGPLLAIDDRVNQRIDVHLWDQANQYVTVSGGQVQASAGVADFSRNGLSVNSPLVPNAAFAQALADSYYAFYSKQRRMLETVLADRDGTIYQGLDRVTLDGIRYMVYESNHDLTGDQVSVQLLEDV